MRTRGHEHASDSVICAAEETGATAVEYALLAAFIAAVIVAVVTAVGLRVGEIFADPVLHNALTP